MNNEIQKTFPRDMFLYFLSIITLAVSAIAFGTLLFQYTNIYISDPLTDSFRPISSHFGAIRQALASLVIVFPVYIWVSWFLQKDLQRYPEKRELKIRKWLLYLTLFVASIIIIVDLVTLVLRFLEGELTLRFILKISSILFITGSVFSYYLWNLKNEKMAIKNPKMRIFVWAMIGIVAVTMVVGFFVAGAPSSERARRFDGRRVSDLQLIQNEVINYWQLKGELPQDLDVLRDDIRGFVPPQDPLSNNAYEYELKGSLTFELCATFQTETQENERLENERLKLRAVPPAEFFTPRNFDSWEHDAGRTCFERTIDPELYPKR